MKPIKIMMLLGFALVLAACGGGTSTDSVQNASDLSSQEQAQLVASALSAPQGGVEDDIATASDAAVGGLQQSQARNASFGYAVSVSIDFYDDQDNLQQAYDPDTTDRIDYQSLIQGQISSGTGFFYELSIDNQSDFTVRQILSGIAWINGVHTNHSAYRRFQPLTQADVHFQLDSELILTDVTVDLEASDTFPESGTVEGSLTGSYERVAPAWRQSSSFNFHFIATYLGDNTAEVELGSGTTFTVRLDTGAVQNLE